MKLYFSCSITGGRTDQPIYVELVRALQTAGHLVLTAHFAAASMHEDSIEEAPTVYQRDMAWLQECEAVIAEVSTPSHGVGYEIAYALLMLQRPVLCLHRTTVRVSKLIAGNTSPTIQVRSYSTAAEACEVALAYLRRL